MYKPLSASSCPDTEQRFEHHLIANTLRSGGSSGSVTKLSQAFMNRYSRWGRGWFVRPADCFGTVMDGQFSSCCTCIPFNSVLFHVNLSLLQFPIDISVIDGGRIKSSAKLSHWNTRKLFRCGKTRVLVGAGSPFSCAGPTRLLQLWTSKCFRDSKLWNKSTGQ
jgi:hypothetical protein